MTGPWTVWLASYPKSGNTWVRAMLAALRSDAGEPDLDLRDLGGGPIASNRPFLERWFGFASSDLTRDELDRLRPLCDAAFDRELDEVRFRKIHDALWTRHGAIVPPDRTRGAIYVVRDPRDVAVSFAHHAGRSPEWGVGVLGREESDMIGLGNEMEPQAHQRIGTWSGHVTGWTEQELFPVLVVRYEDMIEDPERELGRMVRFAGLDASSERLAAAARAARFEVLREKEERDGFAERPGLDRPFFRRGRAGGWREELAPELVARVEAEHAEVMALLGYGPAASPVRPAERSTSR